MRKRKVLFLIPIAIVLTLLLGMPGPRTIAVANAVRAGFDSNVFQGNDDESTGLVPLGFAVNFFGTSYSSLYVNNNGNLTFDFPLFTYTPFDLTSTGQVIIAPFFADVDTRVGNVATYGAGSVSGRPAFGVTWPGVGCYNFNTSVLNYFQVVLIDRSDVSPGDFDIEFNYNSIQWETGQASGGDAACRGGAPARVGYSNGTGAPGTSFELPGSGLNGAFLDSNTATGLINNSVNSGTLGRYVFPVRGGIPVQEGLEFKGSCNNGLDDDQDGLIDGADPGCQFTGPIINQSTILTNPAIANRIVAITCPVPNPRIRVTGPGVAFTFVTQALRFLWPAQQSGTATIECFSDKILLVSAQRRVLVDPSGQIFDTATNLSIPGAMVTLEVYDSGSGTFIPMDPVTHAGLFDPELNPEVTGVDGRYAWDVADGTYRVQVQTTECGSATSSQVIIPPPVTDLDVGLICPDPDGDGLPTIVELTIGTDPSLFDTDGDAISDADEDPDTDALGNLSELATYHTDPLLHDSDADICSDGQELGPNASQGGQRDPNNPWDYFNPTKDGVNRGDDIAAVVAKFGHDQGVATDYSTNYDRNGPIPGLNGWNLLPPNGTIRAFDIAAAVRSFGHDCGPYA